MELKGVSIDFDDRKTCGLLPDLCLTWDLRANELSDDTELINYWENNLQKVLQDSTKIVSGNMGTQSILYSADEATIDLIKKHFKELNLETIQYDEILKCENCLHHDYLDENFQTN